jgi:The  BURPS668_1122 family of deaminases
LTELAAAIQKTKDFFGSEATVGQLKTKDRKLIKDGQKSVTFAEIDIEGLPKTLRGLSSQKKLEGELFDNVPSYVNPENRELKSLKFKDSKLNPAADGEAKIAEYIYRNTNKDTRGTIRIVTDRPACDSCSRILTNLARERPNLNIEIVETPR